MSNSTNIGNSHQRVPANPVQTNAAQPDVGVALINNRGVAQTISWREHVEGAHDFLFFARSCYNLAQFSHALEGAPTPLESRVVQAGTDDHTAPIPTGHGILDNAPSLQHLPPPPDSGQDLGNAGKNTTRNGGVPLSMLLNDEHDGVGAFEWPSFAPHSSPGINSNNNAILADRANASASAHPQGYANNNNAVPPPSPMGLNPTWRQQTQAITTADAAPSNQLNSYKLRQLDRLERRQIEYPHIEISDKVRAIVDSKLELLEKGSIFINKNRKSSKSQALNEDEKMAVYHIYRTYTYTYEDIGRVFDCSIMPLCRAIRQILEDYRSREKGNG